MQADAEAAGSLLKVGFESNDSDTRTQAIVAPTRFPDLSARPSALLLLAKERNPQTRTLLRMLPSAHSLRTKKINKIKFDSGPPAPICISISKLRTDCGGAKS